MLYLNSHKLMTVFEPAIYKSQSHPLFTHPPKPLPPGDHQFVLFICELVSVLFIHLRWKFLYHSCSYTEAHSDLPMAMPSSAKYRVFKLMETKLPRICVTSPYSHPYTLGIGKQVIRRLCPAPLCLPTPLLAPCPAF